MSAPDIIEAVLPVTRLLAELKIPYHPQYYVDELMIAEAIERRSSFNLIHLPSSLKVDVFVPPDGPYPRTAAAGFPSASGWTSPE